MQFEAILGVADWQGGQTGVVRRGLINDFEPDLERRRAIIRAAGEEMEARGRVVDAVGLCVHCHVHRQSQGGGSFVLVPPPPLPSPHRVIPSYHRWRSKASVLASGTRVRTLTCTITITAH